MGGTVRRRGTSRAALLVCIGLLSVAIGGAFGLEAEQQRQQQGGQGEGAVSPGGDGGRVGDAPSGSASSREPERMSAQSEGRKVPHPAAGAGDGMGGFDPALVGGIIAAVVIGGGGAYFLLFAGEGKKKFKGDAVFLIGPSGGGKTAIFFKLLDGGVQSKSSLRPTQASMIENEAKIDLDGASKPIRVIDCPGHLRLRPKLFSSLADCCAVVFVIDSTTFVSQAKEAAEILLDLMCSPALLKNADRLLVVCNKTDAMPDELAGILPKNLVKKRLETEIENLRASRSSGLGDTDENSESMQLEIEGKVFKWSDSPLAPEFIDFSAKQDGLGPIADFIGSAA